MYAVRANLYLGVDIFQELLLRTPQMMARCTYHVAYNSSKIMNDDMLISWDLRSQCILMGYRNWEQRGVPIVPKRGKKWKNGRNGLEGFIEMNYKAL